MATSRPVVKILVAVWGEAFIRNFERFGLGSFLAPGNLPAFSRNHDVEFVILARAEDEATFEALPAMKQIRRHARIRHVPIDDLIAPPQYSTTLHLAFTRGVAQFGEAMTGMHFIFWNADFVLSDGALTHLASRIAAGQKVIITGTLRAVAEQVESQLAAMRDPETGVLAARPRELVNLAFTFPHPHHVAKTVNQTACWSSMPSQMLWRIDAHMQLGRFFKAFMFCLKPTRVVTAINGPSDYAFVPEFCPGEPQHLIADSDDAFILEVQHREAESEFISVGPPDEDERRACMSEWLTQEHLDTGRRVIVFRSNGGTSPEATAEARIAFQEYFDLFMQGVSEPRSHRAQYYWLFGVASWKLNRDAMPGARDEPPPPELDLKLTLDDLKHPTNERHRRAVAPPAASDSLKSQLRSVFFGEPCRPDGLHPDAPATAILDEAAAEARASSGGRLLTVGELGGWLDKTLPLDDPSIYRLEPVPAGYWPLSGPPHAGAVLVYARPNEDHDAALLLKRIGGALADGAHVIFVWHDPGFKGRPGWIDEQLKAALGLYGQLEDVVIRRYEAEARDRAYAAAVYRAMPHFVDANARRPGAAGFMRLGAAMLLQLLGAGSRAPSGRPIVATLTGRYRAVQASEAAVRPAIVESIARKQARRSSEP